MSWLTMFLGLGAIVGLVVGFGWVYLSSRFLMPKIVAKWARVAADAENATQRETAELRVQMYESMAPWFVPMAYVWFSATGAVIGFAGASSLAGFLGVSE